MAQPSTPISLLDKLCRQPAPADWERLVQLYTPLLYTWARRYGLSRADAPDLVQEMFLLLATRLRDFQYDPRRSFRGWLRTVFLNKLREQRRKRNVLVGAEPLDPEHAPTEDDVTAWIETEYRQELIRQAFRLLRVEFTEPVWQACFETAVNGRPVADVGRELGMSADAVYQARSRVLRRLRQELHGLLE